MIAIGISLIVSAVVQLVQSILSIVQVANQSQATTTSENSTTNMYNPYYSKPSAYVRISKYPSRTTVNYGL